MILNYTLRGSVVVPDGSTIDRTVLVLPTGQRIKLWMCCEEQILPSDDHFDRDYDEMFAMGVDLATDFFDRELELIEDVA